LHAPAARYLAFEYLDHDLSGLIEASGAGMTEDHVRCYARQLTRGVAHMHSLEILHRDIKASNLLISNRGHLKIGDWGLARGKAGPGVRPFGGDASARVEPARFDGASSARAEEQFLARSISSGTGDVDLSDRRTATASSTTRTASSRSGTGRRSCYWAPRRRRTAICPR